MWSKSYTHNWQLRVAILVQLFYLTVERWSVMYIHIFLLVGQRHRWELLHHRLLHKSLVVLAVFPLPLLGHTESHCTGLGFQDPQSQNQSVEWFQRNLGSSLHHNGDWYRINSSECFAGKLQQYPAATVLWRSADCSNVYSRIDLYTKGTHTYA